MNVLQLASFCSWLIVLSWSWPLFVPSWLFCCGVGVSMFLFECFYFELTSLCSLLNVLQLASLCSWLIPLFWSWNLYVPSWMFCFGVGVFLFLVDCFVLKLTFLCSWLIVLLWSWRLYVPGWMFCLGVGVSMFLVDCFVFGVAVFIFLVEGFVLELAPLCLWLIVLFWNWHIYVPSWLFCCGVGVFMFLFECFDFELTSLCS